MLEKLTPFLAALAIGLLIGTEREREKGVNNPALTLGIRTISLLAILGAIGAHLHNAYLTLILGFFATCLIIVSYVMQSFASKQKYIGITSEIAAMTAFILGFMAYYEAKMAVMFAIIVVVLLAAKENIHAFVHHKIKNQEKSAALIFLIIAFVVLPLLPNQYIDKWQLINPTKLWLILVFIAGVEFGSYVLLRAFKVKWGILLSGLLGGLASSTSTTLVLAQYTKTRGHLCWSIASGMVLAQVASFSIQLAIFSLIAPQQLARISPVLLAPLVTGIFIALVIHYWVHPKKKIGHIELNLTSPITFKRTIIFAFTIALFVVFINLASRLFAVEGLYLTSLVGGTVSVRAISFALADLINGSEQMLIANAALALVLALTANALSRLFFIWRFGHRQLLAICTSLFVLMLLSSFGGYWLILNNVNLL